MKTSRIWIVAPLVLASLFTLSACQGQAFREARPAPAEQRNDSGLVFRTY